MVFLSARGVYSTWLIDCIVFVLFQTNQGGFGIIWRAGLTIAVRVWWVSEIHTLYDYRRRGVNLSYWNRFNKDLSLQSNLLIVPRGRQQQRGEDKGRSDCYLMGPHGRYMGPLFSISWPPCPSDSWPSLLGLVNNNNPSADVTRLTEQVAALRIPVKRYWSSRLECIETLWRIGQRSAISNAILIFMFEWLSSNGFEQQCSNCGGMSAQTYRPVYTQSFWLICLEFNSIVVRMANRQRAFFFSLLLFRPAAQHVAFPYWEEIGRSCHNCSTNDDQLFPP